MVWFTTPLHVVPLRGRDSSVGTAGLDVPGCMPSVQDFALIHSVHPVSCLLHYRSSLVLYLRLLHYRSSLLLFLSPTLSLLLTIYCSCLLHYSSSLVLYLRLLHYRSSLLLFPSPTLSLLLTIYYSCLLHYSPSLLRKPPVRNHFLLGKIAVAFYH
jgi:hypothetical protein